MISLLLGVVDEKTEGHWAKGTGYGVGSTHVENVRKSFFLIHFNNLS